MPMDQFTYLFAFGTVFACLDAFNIGANDVANSFATSVSSKSLTMKQACFAAAIMEFCGAVLVGARVADTIKNGIIRADIFQGNPGVQMLAFVCALTTSACWLTVCTRLSWPVSTTYSLVSAVAGVGVAVGGAEAVQWGWNGGKGLATIFAGFAIAPSISAGFAAVVYLFVRYGVLARRNPIPWALFTGPLVFFTVTAVMTMSIIYKGAPSLGLNKLSEEVTAAGIVGSAAVISGLSVVFWVPYVYCKVIRKDYTIRFYHFFLGPALWFRKTPADAGSIGVDAHVPDYRIRKENDIDVRVPVSEDDVESGSKEDKEAAAAGHAGHDQLTPSPLSTELEKVDEHPIVGAWAEPKNLYIIARYKAVPFIVKIFTHGTSLDIHAAQSGREGSAHAQKMAEVFARAKQYPNEVEHMYSFVQVLTACCASFAHGANDVSNAIGPYAVIYHCWSTGTLSEKKSPVPVWILVMGGACIVVGLATYGYNIMRALGNNITLHSPSRGFSMELGAAITVILASQYGLPVSTTMCITGATIGVGLCNGDAKAINWKAIAWIVMGWLVTVPIVGTLAGCLMGIILNAPHFAL